MQQKLEFHFANILWKYYSRGIRKPIIQVQNFSVVHKIFIKWKSFRIE